MAVQLHVTSAGVGPRLSGSTPHCRVKTVCAVPSALTPDSSWINAVLAVGTWIMSCWGHSHSAAGAPSLART